MLEQYISIACGRNDDRSDGPSDGDPLGHRTEMMTSQDTATSSFRYLPRKVLDHLSVAVAMTDVSGRTLYANPAVCDLLGYSHAEITASPVTTILQGNDQDHGDLETVVDFLTQHPTEFQQEMRCRHKNGQPIWVLITVSAIRDEQDQPFYLVYQIQDVTERKLEDHRLFQLANYDYLTGLFNRYRFTEELQRALPMARRYQLTGAMLFLDLDRFKEVNDTFGHLAGDTLLKDVARWLGQHLRASDIVARWGGDEFAILLHHVSAQEASTIAAKLLQQLETTPFTLNGTSVRVTGSLGIAPYPTNDTTAEELMHQADVAMYAAKQDGRNQYWLYNGKERNASVRSDPR